MSSLKLLLNPCNVDTFVISIAYLNLRPYTLETYAARHARMPVRARTSSPKSRSSRECDAEMQMRVRLSSSSVAGKPTTTTATF